MKQLLAVMALVLSVGISKLANGQTLTNAWWDGPASAPVVHLRYDGVTTGSPIPGDWNLDFYNSDYSVWGGATVAEGFASYDVAASEWYQPLLGNAPFTFPIPDGSYDWAGAGFNPNEPFTVSGGVPGQIGSFQAPLVPEAGTAGLALASGLLLTLTRTRRRQSVPCTGNLPTGQGVT